MNFDIVRESIFNPDSNISSIMNDLLKIMHEENKINDYSIDVKEEYKVFELTSDFVRVNSWFDEVTAVDIGDGNMDSCLISGVYRNHGDDDVERNHLSVILNDETGFYSIRTEKDDNNKFNLCFKYFDPYTINDLREVTMVANRFLTAEDYMRMGRVEEVGFRPAMKETFSMEEGSRKVSDFVRSALRGEMDRVEFSKIVEGELERHIYR